VKRSDMDALMDRLATTRPELPTAVLSDSSIEPGTVMVAVRTAAGSIMLAIDAKEWDSLRAADALGFEVPAPVRKMAQETMAGRWTADAQDRRARAAAEAAKVAAEKPAKPAKRARP
jgi:hypothetical protein